MLLLQVYMCCGNFILLVLIGSIHSVLIVTKDYQTLFENYVLVFDRQDESQQYHFSANSEAEYNVWTEHIKDARYHGLQSHIHKCIIIICFKIQIYVCMQPCYIIQQNIWGLSLALHHQLSFILLIRHIFVILTVMKSLRKNCRSFANKLLI